MTDLLIEFKQFVIDQAKLDFPNELVNGDIKIFNLESDWASEYYANPIEPSYQGSLKLFDIISKHFAII